MNSRKGFTLIELLVVIAIIAIISSIAISSLNTSRKKSRDARRLMDIKQITMALELYYDKYRVYPNNTDNDCSGWDAGFNGGPASGDLFIRPLENAGFISKTPGDPITTGNCGGYAYYRYPAGSYTCSASLGAYFVLGIRDMETSGNPYPQSPGWKCPPGCTTGCNRNWQTEFEWVMGKFE